MGNLVGNRNGAKNLNKLLDIDNEAVSVEMYLSFTKNDIVDHIHIVFGRINKEVPNHMVIGAAQERNAKGITPVLK